MAIQNINLGALPLGTGGDTFRSAATKINENFSNTTHAASKLVGTASGQIPLAQDTLKAAFSNTPEYITTLDTTNNDVDNYEEGSWNMLNSGLAIANRPYAYFPQILTLKGHSRSLIQLAFPYISSTTQAGTTSLHWRCRSGSSGSAWSPWRQFNESVESYLTTTAAGANAVIDSSGKLMRSTSSERYKDILSPLVLTDEVYNNAISLKPIVYRSTAEADNPLHHYYSFSAEELGSFDKAFTLWRTTETKEVTKVDEEGKEYQVTEEVELAEPLAEGININALLAFTHAINRKQASLINKLEERIKTLEALVTPKEVTPTKEV